MMRCLSPIETEAIFGRFGFSVSLENSWYRLALVVDRSLVGSQTRIGFRPPLDIRQISRFILALNRWFPSDRERLLWIDHWEPGIYGFDNAIVVAARAGMGEIRSLSEAPGHYFDKHPWHEEDQLAITPEQGRSLGLLVGLISMVMITSSDGWLIAADCPDRVEFWEGNLFFHSLDPIKIAEANQILKEFSCLTELE